MKKRYIKEKFNRTKLFFNKDKLTFSWYEWLLIKIFMFAFFINNAISQQIWLMRLYYYSNLKSIQFIQLELIRYKRFNFLKIILIEY